jgi:hypothetical protein
MHFLILNLYPSLILDKLLFKFLVLLREQFHLGELKLLYDCIFRHSEIHECFIWQEECSVVNDRTSVQFFNNELIVFKALVNIDHSGLYEVQRCSLVIRHLEYLSLLMSLCFTVVQYIMESILANVLQVIDLLKPLNHEFL